MSWVDAGTANFINLDHVVEAYPTGSASTWQVVVHLSSDTTRTLPGTYATQADAQARIRELFNAVPLADIT